MVLYCFENLISSTHIFLSSMVVLNDLLILSTGSSVYRFICAQVIVALLIGNKNSKTKFHIKLQFLYFYFHTALTVVKAFQKHTDAEFRSAKDCSVIYF